MCIGIRSTRRININNNNKVRGEEGARVRGGASGCGLGGVCSRWWRKGTTTRKRQERARRAEIDGWGKGTRGERLFLYSVDR